MSSIRPLFVNIRSVHNLLRSKLLFDSVKQGTKCCYSSYITSKPEGDPKNYTDYEVIKNPEEWKYVERLLPKALIPVPSVKEQYPSGWKPVTAKPEDFPYFVERTKNHLVPVYLEISHRGTMRITKLRRISGDIWSLKTSLLQYLEKVNNKPIGIQVDEIAGVITFRGDHVNNIKSWLLEKGF